MTAPCLLQIGSTQRVCYTVEPRRTCDGLAGTLAGTCCSTLQQQLWKIEMEAGEQGARPEGLACRW